MATTWSSPVAVYLLVLWLLHRRPGLHGSWLTPFVALLVLATPWTPGPVLASAAAAFRRKRRAGGTVASGLAPDGR